MFLNNIQAAAIGAAIPWDLVRESFWPIFLRGIYYSIPLAILSFIFGMIIALITALARMSKSRILRAVFGIYVSAIRGTPLLVSYSLFFTCFQHFKSRLTRFRARSLPFH
jgi:cystine transport system permease protein